LGALYKGAKPSYKKENMKKILELAETKEGIMNLMRGWFLGCLLLDGAYNLVYFLL
jgi:predicted nucleic acid-binding protein